MLPGDRRTALMKPEVKRLVIMGLLGFSSLVCAQDTHFEPDHQQIPVPDCLSPKGVWEGESKPCTSEDHEAWLADIRHWRSERLIRVGYDGSRYDLPATQVDAIQFLPAANDGAGPLLL